MKCGTLIAMCAVSLTLCAFPPAMSAAMFLAASFFSATFNTLMGLDMAEEEEEEEEVQCLVKRGRKDFHMN